MIKVTHTAPHKPSSYDPHKPSERWGGGWGRVKGLHILVFSGAQGFVIMNIYIFLPLAFTAAEYSCNLSVPLRQCDLLLALICV